MRLLPASVAKLLLLAGFLGASGCSPSAASSAGRDAGAADPAAAPRAVRMARVTEASWPRTLRVTGELAAFEAATISTKVPGRIESLAVDLGTHVRKGETLARIERRDFELRAAQSLAALQAARARLGLAADGSDAGRDEVDPRSTPVVRSAQSELDDALREHARLAGLVADGIASQAELDSADARRLAAESRMQDALEEVQNRRALLAQRRAELDLARQQLADTEIVAPFDGAVAARLADRGEYVTAGDAILRLVRFDPVRLRLRVPEPAAAGVASGQTVRMRVEDGGAAPGVREATIVRLSPEVDARTRTLLFEAEFANPDNALRPGAFASAEVVVDAAAQTLLVPAEALVRFAGVDRLFVVDGDVAKEQRVTVGRIDGERSEILGGVAAGATVVLAPGNLRSGTRVRAAD